MALTIERELGHRQVAVAEAVAEHWFAAGELEPALAAAVAAGERGSSGARSGDVWGHYDRALELWDRVADPGAVAGVGRPALLEHAAEVASGAGEHDLAIGYVDAAVDELEHAAAALERPGLLYAQKRLYMWRAGRDAAELLEWTERASALVPSEPPTPGRVAGLAEHAIALGVLGRAV